jgi:uncharacterized protein (TIGR04255 family)
LSIITEFVDVDLVERIGLRYVDLVRPQEGEDPALYLDPGLLGFPFQRVSGIPTSRPTFRIESQATTTQGFLAVRCSWPDKQLYLPPDMIPTVLAFEFQLQPNERPVILDFDHYSVEVRDFVPGRIVDAVADLHDAIDVAFRKAVTDYAFKTWGREGSR